MIMSHTRIHINPYAIHAARRWFAKLPNRRVDIDRESNLLRKSLYPTASIIFVWDRIPRKYTGPAI